MNDAIFPLEIFDKILDDLAIEETSELTQIRQCSLVCKDFVPICRSHIFHSVYLCIDPYDRDAETAKRLAIILNQQPEVASCIKRLQCSRSRFEEETDCEAGLWSKSVLKSFFRLPSLTELVLNLYRGGLSYDKLSTSALSHRTLLEHYLTTATLQTLRIHGIVDLPVLPILSAPGIVRVEIRACHLRSQGGELSSQFSAKVRFPVKELVLFRVTNLAPSTLYYLKELKSMSLEEVSCVEGNTLDIVRGNATHSLMLLDDLECSSGVDWDAICAVAETVGQKAFPGIKSLRVVCGEAGDDQKIYRILEHVSSLEEVWMTDVTNSELVLKEESDIFDIGRLMRRNSHSLKSLKGSWKITGYSELAAKVICDGMESVQGNNVIEVLDLSITFDLNTDRSEYPKLELKSEFPQWRRFADIILNDPQGFPRLRHLVLNIMLFIQGELLVDEIDDIELEHFLDVPLHRLFNTSSVTFDPTIQVVRWKL